MRDRLLIVKVGAAVFYEQHKHNFFSSFFYKEKLTYNHNFNCGQD